MTPREESLPTIEGSLLAVPEVHPVLADSISYLLMICMMLLKLAGRTVLYDSIHSLMRVESGNVFCRLPETFKMHVQKTASTV